MTSALDLITTDHLWQLFDTAADQHADRLATRVKRGGVWDDLTYGQLRDLARSVARALVRQGIGVGDRVALFAPNLPEWTAIDLAVNLAGAVLVPLYATSTPEQISHIVGDSGARLMVIGGEKEAGRVLASRDQINAEWPVISIDGQVRDGIIGLRGWLDAETPDERTEGDAELDRRVAEARADDLTAIVYTSGTTGDPKGVMLTHGGMVAQCRAVGDLFEFSPEDHSLSFLPLSHALERAWQFIVIAYGCRNTYCPNPREVAGMLTEVRPTLLVSVPKLYETVYRVAHEKADVSPVKQTVFSWAVRVGGQMQHSYRKGRRPSIVWRAQLGLADKLVLKNIRDAMGGTKTVLACGGAPLRREVEEFFSAAGMPIFTGYGLTEASPLVSFNSPSAFKVSSAGRVMGGGELRIGAESEVLYRGPNLMAGYWNQPEATAQVIDEAGWLHTGDAGYVDGDGFLFITDRIKDIIVTLGGKNVAPQPIEGLVLADPLFEHAVLIGEGRPTLTMLVRPSLPHLEELAEKLQLPKGSPADLVNHPAVVEEFKARVAALTAKLPSHEQIRDLRASIEEFTMDNGLLTPTLKVRRREVEKKFSNLIDEMYARIAEFRKHRSVE
ncbi:AMP-dependent synthetase/ligase [Aestuariimicrobium kwangyangense]|uniref:AMP-dependent synthetase/ligase n=1 Tax=Aestuariimicrobium kwangyangense TaxID=396389 RepID=UPI0003B3CBC1|nr:long-chain fatty acid--CoA ligase [Aestuariimicrobium kwangyangense]